MWIFEKETLSTSIFVFDVMCIFFVFYFELIKAPILYCGSNSNSNCNKLDDGIDVNVTVKAESNIN